MYRPFYWYCWAESKGGKKCKEKQTVQMGFFLFRFFFPVSKIDSIFYSERLKSFYWWFLSNGKAFCLVWRDYSYQMSCPLSPLFSIDVTFSTSASITFSPTPRRMRCPACQALSLRTGRNSSCLRCHSMTADRQGSASASKETSPGRRERIWGSSSNPSYMEGLHTRCWNILIGKINRNYYTRRNWLGNSERIAFILISILVAEEKKNLQRKSLRVQFFN